MDEAHTNPGPRGTTVERRRAQHGTAPAATAAALGRAASMAVAAVCTLGGCAGVMQDPLPRQPAEHVLHAAGESLLVGAAEADITPRDLPYLAGFTPARRATGVHSPLAARALVLALGDVKIAIVGLDNLGLQRDDADWIKTGIAGFPAAAVLLCSSHTHAGPDLVGLWGFWLLSSGRDRGYLTQVRAAVARAVAAADAAKRPAELLRGEARVPPEGIVKNANRRGVFDPRVTVLHAREAATRAPLGTLLLLGCHPEALRRANTLVSADFAGAWCARWQAAGLGQAVFVNGALGAMVSPVPREPEGVAAMADVLQAVAERALAAAVPVAAQVLELRRRDLYLPLTSPGLLLGRLSLAVPRRGYDDHLRTTVGWLRLGSIEAVLVPGEMEPVLAARIRQAAGKPDLLLLGLVDDEVGYLLREVDARDPEFAYERSMSPSADAGERVARALVGALRTSR